jgi:saccharopine dehydrogenase-like NADP-dependent oxidoreductase
VRDYGVGGMRVVVIGGYGNFGARVCRGLAASGMEVIAAGRNPEDGEAAFGDLPVKHTRLDRSAPDFPTALKRLAPDLVVHCAGPFQAQDYRVARAALGAGSHYFDLADGRQFVARFAQNLQSAARSAERLAVSGASSVPALSSAVIASLKGRLAAIDEI